jgi:ABC-type lipoprotein release transport system permease subunit
MTLSVYQKMEEIGTLKAIGFNEKEINFLFTLEALLISILGSISGIILGLIINYFPYKYGMDLTKMIDPSQLSSFNTQSIIYSTYNIKPIFTSLFLGILLPYFFTRSIVKRASKLEPAFILRKIQ